MIYQVQMQFIPGNDQIWVARLTPDDPIYEYDNQAEADAAKSGFETRQFYTLAVDPTNGKPVLETVDQTDLDASNSGNITAAAENGIPVRTGYTGYLVGDGAPVNGYAPQNGTLSPFGFGIQA